MFASNVDARVSQLSSNSSKAHLKGYHVSDRPQTKKMLMKKYLTTHHFSRQPRAGGRDKALEAELQPAQTALEPGDQAARNVLALRRRVFFSAGVLFCIASHIPVETAQ